METQNLLVIDKTRKPWTYQLKESADVALLQESQLVVNPEPGFNVNFGNGLRSLRELYNEDPESFELRLLNRCNAESHFILTMIITTAMDDNTAMRYKQTWDLDVIKRAIKQTNQYARLNRILNTLVRLTPNERSFHHYGVETNENDKAMLEAIRRIVFDRWGYQENA